jgi:ribosomal protein S18 acetylase RimI-like enzyme
MIRTFSLSDLDRILQIELQSFPKSPYDLVTFLHLHYNYSKTFLVYVNPALDREEGQILGYIVFTGKGHIISIAVHYLHRRKGVGKELLERVMRLPHIKKVWAEVRKSNKGAQAFYLKMGFQITGGVPKYYGNEDALIMEWAPLSPTSSASSP